ncbi:hypothetical protein XENOCAPTIV_006265, partial [Xenoophorus captivus]
NKGRREEDEITYGDIKISQSKQRKSKAGKGDDPAAVYSAVRTGEVTYGEIVIKKKKEKSKMRESQPDPDVVYSSLNSSRVNQ